MDNKKETPFNLNPVFVKKQKSDRSLQFYIDGVLRSDRYVLSEAITLVESDEDGRQEMAAQLIDYFYKQNKNVQSIRIAITGAPGVGKSTFIEHFGKYLADQNKKIAVLAIDPSSQLHKGSILGDKTRMEQLSTHDNVYIRPSAAGTMLGGVAKGTKESILLCEAAGYEIILIETVGVGQSEYLASMMADMTILLLQPGAGDEMQGIKKGIMEMADLIIVNKADGDQKVLAAKTEKAYKSVISLLQPKHSKISPNALSVSSINNEGFYDVLAEIEAFKSILGPEFGILRSEQDVFWFEILIKDILYKAFIKNIEVAHSLQELRRDISNGNISVTSAFHQVQNTLLNFYNKA